MDATFLFDNESNKRKLLVFCWPYVAPDAEERASVYGTAYVPEEEDGSSWSVWVYALLAQWAIPTAPSLHPGSAISPLRSNFGFCGLSCAFPEFISRQLSYFEGHTVRMAEALILGRHSLPNPARYRLARGTWTSVATGKSPYMTKSRLTYILTGIPPYHVHNLTR
ncbi:hypothetical protein B0H11DRAFT_2203561 [Mycena galericulata]|nr:hypothetical protein B0H11DRAFT_2203561 [Mycena galericulata]